MPWKKKMLVFFSSHTKLKVKTESFNISYNDE